jgi:hypothetical protein
MRNHRCTSTNQPSIYAQIRVAQKLETHLLAADVVVALVRLGEHLAAAPWPQNSISEEELPLEHLGCKMAGGNDRTSPHRRSVRDAEACWRWSSIFMFFLVGPTQHYPFFTMRVRRLLEIALLLLCGQQLLFQHHHDAPMEVKITVSVRTKIYAPK